MRYWLVAVGCLLAVLSACFSERDATAPPIEGVCSLPVGEGVPGSTLVIVRAFSFTPAELRVRAGDRVTWVNCDPDPHTSSADGGQWSSPLLSTGDAFTHMFDAVGEYTYHCEPHPFMTARVIVE